MDFQITFGDDQFSFGVRKARIENHLIRFDARLHADVFNGGRVLDGLAATTKGEKKKEDPEIFLGTGHLLFFPRNPTDFTEALKQRKRGKSMSDALMVFTDKEAIKRRYRLAWLIFLLNTAVTVALFFIFPQ